MLGRTRFEFFMILFIVIVLVFCCLLIGIRAICSLLFHKKNADKRREYRSNSDCSDDRLLNKGNRVNYEHFLKIILFILTIFFTLLLVPWAVQLKLKSFSFEQLYPLGIYLFLGVFVFFLVRLSREFEQND